MFIQDPVCQLPPYKLGLSKCFICIGKNALYPYCNSFNIIRFYCYAKHGQNNYNYGQNNFSVCNY